MNFSTKHWHRICRRHWHETKSEICISSPICEQHVIYLEQKRFGSFGLLKPFSFQFNCSWLEHEVEVHALCWAKNLVQFQLLLFASNAQFSCGIFLRHSGKGASTSHCWKCCGEIVETWLREPSYEQLYCLFRNFPGLVAMTKMGASAFWYKAIKTLSEPENSQLWWK